MFTHHISYRNNYTYEQHDEGINRFLIRKEHRAAARNGWSGGVWLYRHWNKLRDINILIKYRHAFGFRIWSDQSPNFGKSGGGRRREEEEVRCSSDDGESVKNLEYCFLVRHYLADVCRSLWKLLLSVNSHGSKEVNEEKNEVFHLLNAPLYNKINVFLWLLICTK